jgi:hypothetical protein
MQLFGAVNLAEYSLQEEALSVVLSSHDQYQGTKSHSCNQGKKRDGEKRETDSRKKLKERERERERERE